MSINKIPMILALQDTPGYKDMDRYSSYQSILVNSKKENVDVGVCADNAKVILSFGLAPSCAYYCLLMTYIQHIATGVNDL